MKILEISTRFHWKFWAPKDCIGGLVYFGRWVKVSYRDEDGEAKESDQSWMQYIVKADMGLYR